MSYYREHTHALASGVDPGRVMAELFGKDGGTCRGAGGSMHIYDKDTNFLVRWMAVGVSWLRVEPGRLSSMVSFRLRIVVQGTKLAYTSTG